MFHVLGSSVALMLATAIHDLPIAGLDVACFRPTGDWSRGEHTPIGADGTVDISPSARFCITEAEIVTALYKGIVEVMEAEAAAK